MRVRVQFLRMKWYNFWLWLKCDPEKGATDEQDMNEQFEKLWNVQNI